MESQGLGLIFDDADIAKAETLRFGLQFACEIGYIDSGGGFIVHYSVLRRWSTHTKPFWIISLRCIDCFYQHIISGYVISPELVIRWRMRQPKLTLNDVVFFYGWKIFHNICLIIYFFKKKKHSNGSNRFSIWWPVLLKSMDLLKTPLYEVYSYNLNEKTKWKWQYQR